MLRRIWDRRTIRRMNELREQLASLPWYRELNEKEQFEIAIKITNAQKFSLQQLRFFLDLLPWGVALVAILHR